jgi:isopenicillin-N epimerase
MRDLFLLDPDLVFLNHGSFGACPREVLDTAQHWQREMERNPVLFLGRRSADLLKEARDTLGAWLGAAGADLVFVPNTTTGVNIVARSLALQPGDEVLGTDHEYGACAATWQAVCERAGAVYRRVAVPLPFEADAFVERLCAAFTPRTRVVFASHITSTTALIFPVAELCRAARERGVISVIDGAHAPGQTALDLGATGADFYTGNCHKWLCAPKGAAFLHVRPERQAGIAAGVISWGSVAESLEQAAAQAASAVDAEWQSAVQHLSQFAGRTPLERRLQWQGTRDLSAFLSVPAAIEFQARHGWPALRQRCHDLAIACLHRVRSRNGLPAMARDADHAQMAPIPVRCDNAQALHQQLFERHGIEVPVTRHGNQHFVRVSVQAYNTEAELHKLESALAQLGV